MLEFVAGMIMGGSLGLLIVALCVAAARGDRNDG
jgi:hypothetical protein